MNIALVFFGISVACCVWGFIRDSRVKRQLVEIDTGEVFEVRTRRSQRVARHLAEKVEKA